MEGLSKYHECGFCRTLVIDPMRKRLLGFGEEAPGWIFFLEPKLDSLLSAGSTCRFSQWILDNWSATNSCDWKDLKLRSKEIGLCVDYLSYSFESFPLVEIAWIGLWDPKEEFDEHNGRCRIQSHGYLDVIADPGVYIYPGFCKFPWCCSKTGCSTNIIYLQAIRQLGS